MGSSVPRVSVIIPVYNAERFLGECLDSFTSQTLGDLEVVCVDDGSTDDSVRILRSYAEKDGRVKVLSQENAGPGTARNRGLEASSGEYVYFFDCDDFCKPTLLERAVAVADNENADVVALPFDLYNQQVGVGLHAEWSLRRERYPKGSFTWRDNPDELFETFHNYPWNKLVRRSFLDEQGIRFQEIYLTEDLMFSAPALVKARRIACVDEPLLSHREGLDTNSMSGKHKHPFDFIEAFVSLKEFLLREGVFDELRVAYVNWALNACVYNLMTLRNTASFQEVFERLHESGLEELGLTGESSEQARAQMYDDFYRYLESGDMVGLLHSRYSSARFDADLANYKAAVEFQINEEQRERLRELDRRCVELSNELDVCRQRLDETTRDLERCSDDLERRTRERDEIARVHEEIMNAAEQKVGQAICYVPRVIQRWLLDRQRSDAAFDERGR